ncbi:PepSY domain-containing protein [Bosea sp. NBC_00550]|uniref:PepSY domain-containing protein n=1 Tax=Bosea sp. NBC_00550 TaxID=2969621 RepID=UPI0022312A3F|nr:PepSY domain-containing protein [Bosea sp. NBC_00550]UZF94436.1 PepSY domain-containing protein [Bosea sp. NBC_00550]
MLSRRPILALACIGAFWLHGQLAQAQAPAPITPAKPAVSMDQARRIAADHGVVRIEEIKLDDDKWKVEGRDSTGAEIEIDLRASDGVVIKMERERPASAKAGRS